MLGKFAASTKGMKEEAPLGGRLAFEGIKEWSPCLQGVHGDGKVSFSGQGQLRQEDFKLIGDRGVFDPSINAAFADRRLGEAIQKAGEVVEPPVAALMGEPRM